MSTVWATKHRLHVERCVALVDRLSGEDAPGPAEVADETVRLLLVVLSLLSRHQVDKHGRCRCCGSRWWGRRRPGCSVFRTVDHTMAQPLEVVWWGLFDAGGWDVRLDEVRGWMSGRGCPPPPDAEP